MANETTIRISAVNATTEAFRQVQGNLNKLQGSLRGIAGPLAAAFSAAAVVSYGKSILDTADNLAKLSQKTGVTVEDLSAFQKSAELAGVSSEGLSISMLKLNKALADAAGGAKLQTDALAAVGISQKEIANLSPAQALERIADAFANTEDGANKTQVAMALFGKAGAELIPLLNGGSKALRAFGSTFSTDFAKKAEEFNDNLTILGQNIQVFAVNVLGPVIELLNKLFEPRDVKGLDEAIAKSEARIKALSESTVTAADEYGAFVGTLGSTNDELEREIKNLERLKGLRGEASARETLAKVKKPDLKGISTGVSDEEKRITDELTERNKRITDVLAKARRPVDTLADGLKELNSLYEQGFLDMDTYMDAQMMLQEAFQDTQPKVEMTKTGVEQYAEATKDLAMQIDTAAVNALNNMEDALTGVFMGTMTVQDAFKSMARSIVQDLIKIQIQRSITGPLADALGSFIGPIGKKAIGGSVSLGSPYVVGEKGPELFVPNQNGAIIPNYAMGGGGGTTIVQNLNISTGVSQTVRAEIQNMMPRIAEATKAAVADSKRRGGTFGKMMS